MTNPTPEKIDPRVVESFVKMRSGEMTPHEKDALDAWLETDEASRESFDAVAGLWSGLDSIRAHPAILSLREDAKRQAMWTRWRGFGRGLAAACVVLVVAGAVAAAAWLGRSEPAVQPAAFATGVGQIATFTLADGTVAILDTNSAMRFSATSTRRSVELARGRVLFKVVKDPARPFVVAADGKAVTALGTEFDVYLGSRGMEVTLFEGRVRVEAAPGGAGPAGRTPAIELTPGYKLTAGDTGWSLAHAGPAPAWTEGRLIFDEARLGDIVAEINRYSETQIAIMDVDVAEKRMSAVLPSRKEATFLAAVEAMHLGRVRLRDGRYEISAR